MTAENRSSVLSKTAASADRGLAVFDRLFDEGYRLLAIDVGDTVREAACNGFALFVRRLLETHDTSADDLELGLCGAVAGASVELIELFESRGASDWDAALVSALGNKEMMNLCIARGAEETEAAARVFVNIAANEQATAEGQ